MNSENSILGTEPVSDSDCSSLKSKQSKSQEKNTKPQKCNVVFWNKYSRNIAFDYNGAIVQISLKEPLPICGETVLVVKKNGVYSLAHNEQEEKDNLLFNKLFFESRLGNGIYLLLHIFVLQIYAYFLRKEGKIDFI